MAFERQVARTSTWRGTNTRQDHYALKKDGARAWLADPIPVLALYPHMQAEVGLTAPTPAGLAQIWMNGNAYWAGASARIEGARKRAFAGTGVAADAAGIDAVVAAFRPE